MKNDGHMPIEDHQPRGEASGLSFVVLASPKSGTTWVQKMLSAHPRVHCAETRLFGQHFDPKAGTSVHLTLEQYVRFVSRHYNPPCEPEGRDAYFDSLLGRLIGTIASHARAESGKPIYGEKLTPYRGTAQGVMDRLAVLEGGGVRLIHLVRDCRDVIVSGAAHWQRVVDPGDARADPDTIFRLTLENWVEIETAFEQHRDRFAHVLEVRYEDLLEAPAAEAERIFGFIGADCDAGVIEACVERTSFATLSGGRQRGEVDDSSFYRCGTAGQWRGQLTAEQLACVQEMAGGVMEGLGYGV